MATQPLSATSRLRFITVLLLSLAAAWMLGVQLSQAGPQPRRKPNPGPRLPVAPLPPRSALLTTEDWQKAPWTPIKPGEIDQLIGHELEESKISPAPPTTDEQFIRRATLDLTGALPTTEELQNFLADTQADKRARLIDRLLDSEAYARHWARYWREVVSARLPDRRGQVLGQNFEDWMTHELKANHTWDGIARAMITATGELRYDQPEKNGQAFFLAAHRGKDAADEMAAETSRVFLGIQIQCAQCHDHPSDQWKRVQFHELAGYFARVRERPVKDTSKQKKVVGLELISGLAGEHRMPDKKDPKKLMLTPPRFLNGHAPPIRSGDLERRQSLAREVTSKTNYWFAAAFVNRIWGVLMGQSFYEPVDDMGPKKEVLYPAVLTRLTGAFRGNNYNIKRLFRDVMNSATYQRQVRLSEATDHLHFAASYPTRLPADALWQAVTHALGEFPVPPQLARRLAMRPLARFGGFAMLFQQEFDYDPSLKADEVEGSITQALMLMNNPQINSRLRAGGKTTLAAVLRDYTDNDEAIQQLYLRTLARKPTDREIEKCRTYIEKVGKRAEAFEDIFWALLNSTEFETKR